MSTTHEEARHLSDLLRQQGGEVVQDWVSSSKTIKSVTRLPGDASSRRYYRIQEHDRLMILMQADPFEKEGAQNPFLAIQAHLKQAGVDVPEVVDFDAKRGMILLEDLGDTTLLKRLESVGDTELERQLYEKAIDGLVQLQFKASPPRSPSQLDCMKLRFDFEKLMWEVHFTIEHFYEGYLKRELMPEHKRIIVEGFERICRMLERQPTVFTHRDFHSRNIMVSGERFVMIDFQDARMGPPQYDLASLLRDSYYQLSELQVRKLIDYYLARWKAVSGESLKRRGFHKVFDLMSIQRNFKAIGSFASFLNRRGNPAYLKYIGNTFENIRRNLLKFPEFSRLREVLFHYYYF